MTKRFYLLFALAIIPAGLLLCKQCSAKSQHLVPIVYDKSYVEKLLNFEKYQEDLKKRNIVFKKIAEIKNPFVELYNCFGGGWETDPGDFKRIRIKLSNSQFMEYDNADGWIKFLERSEPLSITLADHVKLPQHSKKIHRHLYGITLDMEREGQILVLFGYPYASSPGLITLIHIVQNTSEIIFNRNFDLFEIRESDSGYSLIGRTDSEDSYSEPYEIAIKDGRLTFETLPMEKVYESQNPHIILYNVIGWNPDKQSSNFTRIEIAAPAGSNEPENQIFDIDYYNDVWTPFPTPVIIPTDTVTIQQTPYFIIVENAVGRTIILNERDHRDSTAGCITILRSAPYYPTSLFNGYFSLQEITEDDVAYHLLGTRKDAVDPNKVYEITIKKSKMSSAKRNW